MGLLADIRNILISLISVKPKGPYAKTPALFAPFGLCYSPSGQKEGHTHYCLRKRKLARLMGQMLPFSTQGD